LGISKKCELPGWSEAEILNFGKYKKCNFSKKVVCLSQRNRSSHHGSKPKFLITQAQVFDHHLKIIKIISSHQVLVPHSCNPSYSRGRRSGGLRFKASPGK
jgi:hypothetical protein